MSFPNSGRELEELEVSIFVFRNSAAQRARQAWFIGESSLKGIRKEGSALPTPEGPMAPIIM